MSVLLVLLPVAISLVALFVAAYAWASRSGQFDDLETPAFRPLVDDRAQARRPNPTCVQPPSPGGPGSG